MSKKCKSCVIAEGQESVPYIYQDDLWTVNLLLGSPPPRLLLGWSVLQPKRHINSLSELNTEELSSLAPLLARCEEAMKDILNVGKVYVCLFAEASDFHMHFHLIPRRPDLPKEYIGPAIFNIEWDDSELATSSEVEELRACLVSALER